MFDMFKTPEKISKNVAISYAIVALNGLIESGVIELTPDSIKNCRNISGTMFSVMDVLMKGNSDTNYQIEITEQAIELIQKGMKTNAKEC